MELITEAKSLRYSITLYDNEIHIKANASVGEKFRDAFKFFKKDKERLINLSYKLQDIAEAKFVDVSIDTSQLVLELKNGDTMMFEMTPLDKNNSKVLKTKTKLIADHIQSRK